MFVNNPWELSSFTQQILANLRPSDRTGYSLIDLLISPKQESLLRQQANIFMALEAGEPIERELPTDREG